MVDHPWSVALRLPARLVRVWVSMGYEGAGASVLAPLSVLYLGCLWCLGVVGCGVAQETGMVFDRRHRRGVLAGSDACTC